MACIFLGEHVGRTVGCCQNPARTVYRCTHADRSHDYCAEIPPADNPIDVILLDERTRRYSLAICRDCPLGEFLPDQPKPQPAAVVRNYSLEADPSSSSVSRWRDVRFQSSEGPALPKPIILDVDRLQTSEVISAAWMAEGSKGRKPEIRFRATGHTADLLLMLGQVLDSGPVTSGEELSANPIARCRRLGSSVGLVRPGCELSSAEITWAESFRADVILVPESSSPNRQWPTSHWLELMRLCQQNGIRAQVLGSSGPLWREYRNVMGGLSWRQIAAVMRSSGMAICSNGPASHLAATIGVSTLVVRAKQPDPILDVSPNVSCFGQVFPQDLFYSIMERMTGNIAAAESLG